MKNQFKPFEQVLVRDHENDVWTCGIYSHYDNNRNDSHVCTDTAWKQCIPYEGNEHLLNTNKPYTLLQQKTFSVAWSTFNEPQRVEYTDEEFENFIKIAVLRNKDIRNFNVRRLC